MEIEAPGEGHGISLQARANEPEESPRIRGDKGKSPVAADGNSEMKNSYVISSLHRKHGGLCAYCNRETTLDGDTALKATRDHIWPLSRGGGEGIDNIVLACRDCNSRKGNSMEAALNGVKALPEMAEHQEESDPWVVDLTKDPNWPIDHVGKEA